MPEKPLIAVTMGDPSGVGPEIIVKALEGGTCRESCDLVVIGDRGAMERALGVCGSSLALREIREPGEARGMGPAELPLIALSALSSDDMAYGGPSERAGDAVYRYIRHATELCLARKVAAMVTAPISKEAMNRAGHDYPGHTELLAELCGTKEYVMMLAGDLLRVSLVTIHEALRDVPSLITAERVLATIRVTAAGVQRLTGVTRPRLAVLALNPHCGEGGMFGNEDAEVIAPAVEAARAEGIDAVGPLSADTLFHFLLKSSAESAPLYDGVIAMYHDQGLIPLKMLHFDDGVNVTLGLPIIRTSVDHGTAYDLAGTGRASEKSLLAAVRMATAMSCSM
jgi:4-hydroxythreonine-4-phosphate dehydrogenase